MTFLTNDENLSNFSLFFAPLLYYMYDLMDIFLISFVFFFFSIMNISIRFQNFKALFLFFVYFL